MLDTLSPDAVCACGMPDLHYSIALQTLEQLQAWRARAAGSDLALFLDIADQTGLAALGTGPGRYLSYGAYAKPDGGHALAQGVWDAGAQQRRALDASRISEDLSHAWYAQSEGAQPLHPTNGLTQPDPDKAGAYTWNKAPRLGGQVVETGAIARQLVDGQPLITQWDGPPPAEYPAEVALAEGAHELQLEYQNMGTPARIQLRWEPVGVPLGEGL